MALPNLCKPFHLRPDEWLRLALFTMGTLYVLLIFGLLWARMPFVGLDFMVFFASAQIALTKGFPQVYDLTVQRAVQRDLLTLYMPSASIETLRFFYLPSFLLPFIPLVPLGMKGGFLLWSLTNIFVFAAYLTWFWRKAQSHGNPTRMLTPSLLRGLALLSFPAFTNFLLGQINVWLMICVGESLRAWEHRKPLRSGLWLGGLLLKPQTLLLILPYMLLRREWQAVLGFAAVSAMVGALSVGLLGVDGLKDWVYQLLSHTGQHPSLAPGIMINFRMVGELISLAVPEEIARSVAALVSVTWALWALIRSLRSRLSGSTQWLVLFAATLAAAWHAHSHMALILIPLLLWETAGKQLAGRLFLCWSLFPSALYLICALILALLQGLGQATLPIAGFTYPALALLSCHLYITVRGLSESDFESAAGV